MPKFWPRPRDLWFEGHFAASKVLPDYLFEASDVAIKSESVSDIVIWSTARSISSFNFIKLFSA